MYVVIFCLGVILIVLEVLASRNNKRIAATSLPGSRWLLMYRWRHLAGAPLAIASAFVSYPLSSGEDHYQITGFPFLVMAVDQRGWDYAGFLSLLGRSLGGRALGGCGRHGQQQLAANASAMRGRAELFDVDRAAVVTDMPLRGQP